MTDWEGVSEKIIKVNVNFLQHKLSIFGFQRIYIYISNDRGAMSQSNQTFLRRSYKLKL